MTSAKDTKFVKVFQRLLETDPFLQQVKGGLAGPKSDGQSKRDLHRTVGVASEVGISTDRRKPSERSAEVSEAGTLVEEPMRKELVAEVRIGGITETAGVDAVSSSQVGDRFRTRGAKSVLEVENGQNDLDGYLSRKSELGASSHAREAVRSSFDGGRRKGADAGASATQAPGSHTYEHTQVNSSRTLRVDGPVRDLPSVSGQAAASAETHHCVQVLDRALEFFKARKREAARKLDTHRDQGGAGKVESRDRRKRGDETERNDVTAASAGHREHVAEMNGVHRAVDTLDRAANLVWTLAA